MWRVNPILPSVTPPPYSVSVHEKILIKRKDVLYEFLKRKLSHPTQSTSSRTFVFLSEKVGTLRLI